jgi:hypothetical protein
LISLGSWVIVSFRIHVHVHVRCPHSRSFGFPFPVPLYISISTKRSSKALPVVSNKNKRKPSQVEFIPPYHPQKKAARAESSLLSSLLSAISAKSL